MKKFLSLLLILSFVFLSACTNANETDTTTEISAEMTETTSASEQTTDTSEETTVGTGEKQYVFETQIRETEALQTEIPALQEKIDANQEKFSWIANKIIIEIGEQKDVPYLMEGHYGEYFDEKHQHPWVWMGGGTNGLVYASKEWLDDRNLPIYFVNSEDTLKLYKNDVREERLSFVILDYSEDENDPNHLFYNDFTKLCEELGSGTHYVYTQVRCEGDYIIVNGEFDETYTEYADFLVFFILEID